MNVTFAPRGILQIDDARIIYRNFSGKGSQYNREGDRNFAVVIPNTEIADALVEAGWNVKIKAPRDEDDTPFMYLPVKVKFNYHGPNVYLLTGNSENKLDEETIECLDFVNITSVNMDIRPYDWEMHGNTGRTAYLQSMEVIQETDRFAEKYSRRHSSEE